MERKEKRDRMERAEAKTQEREGYYWVHIYGPSHIERAPDFTQSEKGSALSA